MTAKILSASAAAVMGLASLLVAPTAGAQSYGAGDGVVGRICTQVVGVEPGEKHYAACVQSLEQSVQNLRHGQSLAVARQTCLARGLEPQTAAFAECELTAAPARGQPAGPPGDTPSPGGSRSYFMISRSTAWQRDQLACARLGFDPDDEAFSGCAVDLRASLTRASEPSM